MVLSGGSGSVGSGRVATVRKNEGKSTPCHQVGTKIARYDEMYLDNLTLRGSLESSQERERNIK